MSNISVDEQTTLQDESSMPECASTPTGTSPPTNQKGETPARARGTDSHSYRNGTLDDRRKAVLEDIGPEIPEVGLDFFFENLLPSLPPIDLDALIESLTNERIILSKSDKWTMIPKEPCNSKQHEIKMFSPLAEIFNAITRLALTQVPSLQQTLVRLLEPNEAPGSERMSMTRSDGYFILKETVENPDHLWYDLACTAEVKKRDSDKDRDNVRNGFLKYLNHSNAFLERHQANFQHAAYNELGSLSPLHFRNNNRKHRHALMVCISCCRKC